MSKPAKPAAPVAPADDQPPKSKKMLIIIVIALIVLLAGGGAAAYFLMKPAHPAKQGEEAAKIEEDSKLPPKFVEIGTFTANLMHEDVDRYLQVAISLKITNPELEEKIKAHNPEIQNIINMLLQSKYPSQLATVEGKQKLASEIKEQVEFLMGLRKTAPAIHSTPPDGETQTAAPASTPGKKGIAAVLFTSFIIQ
jgi:flagellar FliL protein